MVTEGRFEGVLPALRMRKDEKGGQSYISLIILTPVFTRKAIQIIFDKKIQKCCGRDLTFHDEEC